MTDDGRYGAKGRGQGSALGRWGYTVGAAIILSFLSGHFCRAADPELRPAAEIRRYEALVRDYPDNAAYQNALGYYHYKAKHFQEAEIHYLKAIELDGSYVVAHNNIGILYLQQNKPDKAEVHFQRAVELNPDYAKAQYNLAVAFFHQKRYTKALGAYLRARELDSDYVNQRDDPEKMKRALSEATRDNQGREELEKMLRGFAPAY